MQFTDLKTTAVDPHVLTNREVIWVDANIANGENSSYVRVLKESKNMVLFATSSTDEAVRILEKRKKGTEYRVITSGRIGKTFVPKLRKKLGIHCKVLVFCMSVSSHETWARKYKDVAVTASAPVMLRFASWN